LDAASPPGWIKTATANNPEQAAGRWFAFVLLACAVVCCNRP
jgi:hypothetical protein